MHTPAPLQLCENCGYNYHMIEGYYAAYGCNRGNKEIEKLATELDIELLPEKIYLDTKNTRPSHLMKLVKMLGTMRGVAPVTVLVVQLSDFGPGAKAKQVKEDIEAMGHKILVPEREKSKPGPGAPVWNSEEDEEDYKALWHNIATTAAWVILKIKQDTKQDFTRWQLAKMWGPKRKKTTLK